MDTTSIILKTDSRGRVGVPAQLCVVLLHEFERSGGRYQTFATWVQ